MMYIPYNPNPDGLTVGDCVIRALTAVLGQTWFEAYSDLAILGLKMSDMPSANRVWGEFLRQRGFCRYNLPDSCPDCYTVHDFCSDHPIGVYVLATGTHVIGIIDGNYYDAWDSGNEVPIYYWRENGLRISSGMD